MRQTLLALVASLVLTACSTTEVGLSYTPGSGATPSASGGSVAVGTFVDGRGEPAIWLGAIRGGLGNPVKRIDADRPVADLVRAAFVKGLEARKVGIDRESAPFELSGTVLQLECDQYIRREVNVEIQLVVTERATGRRKLVKDYEVTNVDGSLLSAKPAAFASVYELKTMTQKTLSQTVDRALDDAELRAALKI